MVGKHGALLALPQRLDRHLGGNVFDIVDHWEADDSATGIAARDDHSRLLYISMSGDADDCYVELEEAPLEGSDMPYRSVATFDGVTFDRLVTLVRYHLRFG